MIKRIYRDIVNEHFRENDQIVFIAGPRQCGKTTLCKQAQNDTTKSLYLNWDNLDHRKIIVEGPRRIAEEAGLFQLQHEKVLIIFDELHKFRLWKAFLKGFFDTYKDNVRIVVTGSSKLDIYKRGGDSLMGRYFLYRMHPLSVAELVHTDFFSDQEEIQSPHDIAQDAFDALLTYGGFPEPFLKRNQRFLRKWHSSRSHQLIYEDIRDLSKIQDLGQIEILAEILTNQSGGLVNYSTIAARIRVSVDTVRRWMKTLTMFYFSFTIQPWTKNVTRSILKEPKVYVWDWARIHDEGARYETMVAVHLMKALHMWNDRGLGTYDMYFLRDKEKREVDFLITKNGKPWFMVEVKASQSSGVSKNLSYFQKLVRAPHAFQVVFDLPYVNKSCFEEHEPIMVPVKTFLSQLV